MSLREEREQTTAIQAVRQAAALCRVVRGGLRPDVLDKKDKSPVTVADFGSQAIVCRIIGEAFPDDPIIAEEDSAELRQPGNAALLDQVVGQVRALSPSGGREVSKEEVCRWIDRGSSCEYRERFWTIDPIDGTKGFLRNEQYAVALALVVKGRIEVAALACPNLTFDGSAGNSRLGVIFTAVRGQGAFALLIDPRALGTSSPPYHPGQRHRETGGNPVLRVGRVRAQRPRRCGGDRGTARNHCASTPDG